MISEFIQFAQSYNWANYVGMEDYADKLSFNITTPLMLFLTMMIGLKGLLFDSISCYVAIKPSGKNFDEYLTDYCWVHGTIPIHSQTAWPDKQVEWEHMDESKRINYYQWVPFMLALQGILFYLPRILWQMITYNMSGADLEGLINMASSATTKTGDDKRSVVQQVAQNLENLLFDRRNIQLHSNRFIQKTSMVKTTLCAGKRSGRRLIFQYLFIKFLYLVNVIGQIFLLQAFLHFNTPENELGGTFGWKLLHNIIKGKEWNETLYFPRVSYCYIRDIQGVGMPNNYLAQCVLPINMLNEKLYIFLWFWLIIVAFLSCLSCLQWIMRIIRSGSRVAFIKKYLRVRQCYESGKDEDRKKLNAFMQGFLRGDGVFILRMLAINAGDLIATDVITELWRIYKDHYFGQGDSSNGDFRKPAVSSVPGSHIASDAGSLPVKDEYV